MSIFGYLYRMIAVAQEPLKETAEDLKENTYSEEEHSCVCKSKPNLKKKKPCKKKEEHGQ